MYCVNLCSLLAPFIRLKAVISICLKPAVRFVDKSTSIFRAPHTAAVKIFAHAHFDLGKVEFVCAKTKAIFQ